MQQQTLDRLQEVFRDQFDDDDIVLSPEMTARDIEDWDSVQHIRLILAVEQAFGIRFSTTEIGDLQNIGDLVGRIEHYLNA